MKFMTIQRLHHVNITVPKDSEKAAHDFYCGVLGLPEIEKPDSLKPRRGFWVKIGGMQVHISLQDGVDRRARNGHIAYQVDDVPAWRAKLETHGIKSLDSIPIEGYDRFEFRDPFGNRVEIIQKL